MRKLGWWIFLICIFSFFNNKYVCCPKKFQIDKRKRDISHRPIMPEYSLPVQPLGTDRHLPSPWPTGWIRVSWAGSEWRALRQWGLRRIAQFRQDDETMRPSWDVLISLSVPSAHPHGSPYLGDQQYLAVDVTRSCATMEQIQSLPFSKPVDAACGARPATKIASGTQSQ